MSVPGTRLKREKNLMEDHIDNQHKNYIMKKEMQHLDYVSPEIEEIAVSLGSGINQTSNVEDPVNPGQDQPM